METLVEKYLASLSARERKAYHLAKDHLGCLFDIHKSTGFINWLKKNGYTDFQDSLQTPTNRHGSNDF